MAARVRKPSRVVLPLVIAVAGMATACDGSFPPAGRASDEWTRSYPLSEGGELQISNTNGIVEIEGGAGSTVDVRAERIAYAATDAAARDVLSRVVIAEEVTPNRVSLDSQPRSSLFRGGTFEVRYHVRVPAAADVRVATTNGRIFLTGLSGLTRARTTNGGVSATGLAGGIVARSTNGPVTVELASLATDDVELRTTNGPVSLTIPASARATIDASVTNGSISVDGLQVETVQRSRRRLSARVNGGGTPITVSTTNGGIRIRPQ